MSEQSDHAEAEGPDVRDYVATTVPVRVDIDVKQVVLDLSEAEAILQQAGSIALGPCECRVSQKKCDAPVDTCLALNSASRSAVENVEGFRYVDVETALAKLRESHEAGLVHLAFRKPGSAVTEFCSCCSCCCWFLKELKRFEYHAAIVESSHIARHLVDRCIGCGTCVEKCSFDAWHAAENGGKPTLDEARCFGCGVCVSTCPAQAIDFVLRTLDS